MQFQAFHCELTEKCDGTQQTNTVMSVGCAQVQHILGQMKASHQGYPPGGGETSREISGRVGAPLLSGATLSEHVTDIVGDGTTAFNEHKASASARPLSVSYTLTLTQTDTEAPFFTPTFLQTVTHTSQQHVHGIERNDQSWGRHFLLELCC